MADGTRQVRGNTGIAAIIVMITDAGILYDF